MRDRRPGHLATAGVAALAAAAAVAGCSSNSTSSGASAPTTATTTAPAASSDSSAPGATAPAANGSADAGKTLQIAYLSFAVANSYDAPMLAAAQAAAAGNNAKLTVFDANNDPKTQFSQLQNAIGTGKYDGIIVQPIFGTGLTDLVKQAIDKGIKVVNIDQVLGPDLTTVDPQVEGLSANVMFNPTDMGTKLGQLTVQACASVNANPCNVGYLFDIKASSLDVAINKAFAAATSSAPVKVVAEGEDLFTPAGGLKAVQNMLTAHPDINAIVGSDQGIEGAVQALDAAKKTGKVLLVGYGGSAAGLNGVKAGTWFGTVMQDPASEGRIGVESLVKAIRDNTVTGGLDPLSQLPDKGIVTKANVDQFTAEWPG
jgi:ribose transport system substrate-binding protein